jgi:hypothetical protein
VNHIVTFFRSVGFISNKQLQKLPNALNWQVLLFFLEMTVVNNSAPRTHPNDNLRYIQKSGMSRDHTQTRSRRSRCLGGVAEVRPCETGWLEQCNLVPRACLSQVKGGHSSREIELIQASDWLAADTTLDFQREFYACYTSYLTFTDKYNLLKNERMFAVKCGPAVDVFKTGLKV